MSLERSVRFISNDRVIVSILRSITACVKSKYLAAKSTSFEYFSFNSFHSDDRHLSQWMSKGGARVSFVYWLSKFWCGAGYRRVRRWHV